MSRLASSITSKSRGRLAAWLAFGAVGLATGAVWATGFDTVGGASGTAGESPALAKTAPDPATSALDGKVAAVDPITYDFDGRWGSIGTNTTMFKVDLSGAAYGGTKRYNIALLLTNSSDITGWATLQLEIENVQENTGGACDPADFNGAQDPKLLNIDDQDAGVYWNGLVGDKVYCIGVDTAAGDDLDGTFLRSAQDAAPTDFPTFITTVDRAL